MPLVAVCAVSSIVLSVRALPPPLSFSSTFFLNFRCLPLGRPQVDGRSHLLLSGALGFTHQKKSSQSLTKATSSLFQPQTPPTTSAKLLKRQSPNLIPNVLLSSSSSPIPPNDPHALAADSLSWPIRRRKLIWIRSSTVCWKVSLPRCPPPFSTFFICKTDGGGLCAGPNFVFAVRSVLVVTPC